MFETYDEGAFLAPFFFFLDWKFLGDVPCCRLCVTANLLATGASEISILKLHLGSCIGDQMLSSVVAEVCTAKQCVQ